MKLQFFDFEVFTHWWMCVLGMEPEDREGFDESIKDTFTVITSDQPDAREHLMSMLKSDVCNVGYNIKHYDLPIANAIYQGFTPEQVHIINDLIIQGESVRYLSKEHQRLWPFASKRMSGIVYQDIMDDNSGHLKEKEAGLGLSIIESSVPFEKENLTDEDKASLEYYCKHDVYSLMYYVFKHHDEINYIEAKLGVGLAFGVDEATCYTHTNPSLIGKVLGAQRRHFDDEEKTDLEVPENLKSFIAENVPDDVTEYLMHSTELRTFRLFDNEVTYGNGGQHSTFAKAMYAASDDEYGLYLVDVSSFYPSLLWYYNCLSRTISDPQIFGDIFLKRLELKAKGKNMTEDDKWLSAAYKLILNSTYGASGCKWLSLYDPYQTTKTCRLGQLILTSLCCYLKKNIPTLDIIQSNTDGILIYVAHKDYDKTMALCSSWSELTHFSTELTKAKAIWQKDVNNYILIREDDTIKNKGGWLRTSYETGGIGIAPLTGYVSAKAVIEWFIHKTPITQTIVQNKNLMDFAITGTKGPTFYGVVQVHKDGTETKLFNVNRYLPAKDKSLGPLYKLKKYKGNVSYNLIPGCPDSCLLINDDLSTYDFKDLQPQIDYSWYVQRCIDLITPPDDVLYLRKDWLKLEHGVISETNEFNIA